MAKDLPESLLPDEPATRAAATRAAAETPPETPAEAAPAAAPEPPEAGPDAAEPAGLPVALTISPSRRVKRGGTDEFGDTVDHVYVSTEHFIIYSAINGAGDAGRLRYVLPDDYLAAKVFRKRLAPVAVELVLVSDILAGIWSTEWRGRPTAVLRARTLDLMARAMQMAFENEPETASDLLERARNEVATRRDSRNRMRYIVANVVAVALLIVGWFFDWGIVGLEGLQAWLSEPRPLPGAEAAYVLRDILALGALGAFFSVSVSINALKVDHSISYQEMLYTGFVRVPIGVIAAGIMVLLITGGWILGSIAAAYLGASLYLFGFLAGFSELLVPNALKQVETRTSVEAPGAPRDG